MDHLIFDEATHTYTIGGRVVPNVTRVLDRFTGNYQHVPPDVLERARQEGTAVHRAIEFHLRGTLDFCPRWIEPFILCWEKFVFDTGFELESSEQRLYHPGLNYAGTSDLIGFMDFPKLGRRHTLIDIKRSFAGGAAIGLQLAAYAMAYNETCWTPVNATTPGIQQRFALRFRPGMSPPYQVEHFNDPADFADWGAMLRTYKWLEREGKL